MWLFSPTVYQSQGENLLTCILFLGKLVHPLVPLVPHLQNEPGHSCVPGAVVLSYQIHSRVGMVLGTQEEYNKYVLAV